MTTTPQFTLYVRNWPVADVQVDTINVLLSGVKTDIAQAPRDVAF